MGRWVEGWWVVVGAGEGGGGWVRVGEVRPAGVAQVHVAVLGLHCLAALIKCDVHHALVRLETLDLWLGLGF